MSKREPQLYLEDIKSSVEKIENYRKGLSLIGEAARNIPEKIKSKNPDIPWSEVMGMRNKVTHEYFGVDEDILWKTIKEDLPSFKKQISELLEKF